MEANTQEAATDWFMRFLIDMARKNSNYHKATTGKSRPTGWVHRLECGDRSLGIGETVPPGPRGSRYYSTTTASRPAGGPAATRNAGSAQT